MIWVVVRIYIFSLQQMLLEAFFLPKTSKLFKRNQNLLIFDMIGNDYEFPNVVCKSLKVVHVDLVPSLKQKIL